MAVFLEIVTDAFEEVLNAQASRRTADGRATRSGRRSARRPTRGLEIKEDTPAALKVIRSDGVEIPLIDSSSPDGRSIDGYTNFILQNVTEARMEKHQIVETFGASYIFFFGENPRFLDVSAIIVNSHDFNWEAEWWENYDQYFRGTKLVEMGAQLYMFYDENVVQGFMVMSQAVKVADQPHLIQLNFRLFLTGYRNVSFIGSPQFPIRDGSFVQDNADLTTSNLSGTALDSALDAGSSDRGSLLTNAVDSGSLAQGAALSDLLRNFSRTGSIDPSVQAALTRLGNPSADGRNGLPFRGLIASNLDEFVGLSVNQISQQGFVQSSSLSSSPQSAITPAARATLESDNLQSSVVEQMSAVGAAVDSPSAMADLGLQPRFSQDDREGASFTPKNTTPFGFESGSDVVVVGRASNVNLSARKDPLTAIFGISSDSQAGDSRFVEGVGDPRYGYRSVFGNRPGFGGAGYGGFGGPGFGSAQGGVGDPGFRDPDSFTLRGATNGQASLARLTRPTPDQSSFGTGRGLGSGSAGLSGGSTVRILGKPSAFSIVSVSGTLQAGS